MQPDLEQWVAWYRKWHFAKTEVDLESDKFQRNQDLMADYYELLQISPNADSETIHRVFKFLAGRLHPDNAQTGNQQKFQQVQAAYDVLSNPVRRRDYDLRRRETQIQPLSLSIDFMDQIDGEMNRRLAVLSVLYYRRRTSANRPDVTLAEIEEHMGFPRDYLDFTLWYLQKKKYLNRTDNACFSLTAEGVDFVESERATLPVLNGLLTSSTDTVGEPVDDDNLPGQRRNGSVPNEENTKSGGHARAHDRRSGKERRVGMPDNRLIKVERRQNTSDRRNGLDDRRVH